jgi:hypothetical protein
MKLADGAPKRDPGARCRPRGKVASSPACSGATPFWDCRRKPLRQNENKKCEPLT